jgi:nucleotide-binding universal stress UspA family protein
MKTTPVSSRVIVGVHDCVSGLEALRRAVAEARRRGVPLHAVRAWNAPATLGPAVATWRGELANDATETVHRAFADAMGAMPPDVDVQIDVVQGYPGHVLVYLASHDNDLLVIGNCQHGWPRGSPIVRYCVNHARCPVLVVPPHELARSGGRRLSRAMRREAERLADTAAG